MEKSKYIKHRTLKTFLITIKEIAKKPRGLIALVLFVSLYTMMIFSSFIAPYKATDIASGDSDNNGYKIYHPPNLRIWSKTLGFGLQVQEHVIIDNFTKKYAAIGGKYHKVYLFTKKSTADRSTQKNIRYHLFGTQTYPVYVFGADGRGRDVFSRIIYGSRVSLTVGIVGVFISISLALIIGGIAGYYGGAIDWIVMRVCEFIILIPSLYIILFLRGIFLDDISPAQTFFVITIILSLIGFPGTARLIRGMIHSIKREDFISAARLDNMKVLPIIKIHILPHLSTILIVSISLAIPSFILGETALSFLGLGITDPSVSWGSLLNKNILTVQEIQQHPWELIPGFFLFITMFAYILLGERIRDVLDPYRSGDNNTL